MPDMYESLNIFSGCYNAKGNLQGMVIHLKQFWKRVEVGGRG